MGEDIEDREFTADDRRRFDLRLAECLEALDVLVSRPGFGRGTPSIGAELEVYLIDAQGLAAPVNAAVLAAADDPHVTLELGRYNLEYNTDPVALAGRPFTAVGRQLDDALARLSAAAAGVGARVIATGILPTLRAQDLEPWVLSDRARYRALSRALRTLRGAPFRLRIRGVESLDALVDDVTAEGAATSFQLHLRVDPDRFTDSYNAAQLATAPVLAVAGNSPVFLRSVLWDETRIALFKQAVDHRPPQGRGVVPARVSFGESWVGGSPVDLFRYEVEHFVPLLPVVSDRGPRAVLASGGTPALEELRVHHSTVWRWNRPVYDPVDGGHLRIEFRSLPAGPTTIDMAANAAFLTGLTLALATKIDDRIARMPFDEAENNFYRAAQSGPDATLAWPESGGELRQVGAAELAVELVPLARDGLVAAGVAAAEADELLAVIAARARSGHTGARWQRAWLAALEQRCGRDRALCELVERYRQHSIAGEPVHSWPLPRSGER